MKNLTINRHYLLNHRKPYNPDNEELLEIPEVSEKGLPWWLQRVIAFFGLLFISPLLIFFILLIRIESKGNPVFSQIRVGENGRRFKLYKLRSMYLKTDKKYKEPDPVTSDRDGVCEKYFHDPRITKIGKIIRKLSIDELPQLFNVVTGDMVLIGPRPALERETNAYRYDMLMRLNCKPGLTGLWQVSGRADTTFEEQIELDLRYVVQRCVMLDIKILLATIPAVLMGKGAY